MRFLRRFVLIVCAIAFAALGGWGTTDHMLALLMATASFSAVVMAAA